MWGAMGTGSRDVGGRGDGQWGCGGAVGTGSRDVDKCSQLGCDGRTLYANPQNRVFRREV